MVSVLRSPDLKRVLFKIVVGVYQLEYLDIRVVKFCLSFKARCPQAKFILNGDLAQSHLPSKICASKVQIATKARTPVINNLVVRECGVPEMPCPVAL